MSEMKRRAAPEQASAEVGGETSAEVSSEVSLHGAYVARQCPVRLFRDRDPFETAEAAAADPALQTLFDEGIAFEDHVVGTLAEIHGDDLVRIAARGADTPAARVEATMTAMQRGARFIAGALLEHDTVGRRLSEVDLLMRVPGDGLDASTPKYWPIDIKHHRATQVPKKPAPAELTDLVVDLDLSPSDGGFVPKRSEADCIQLAHYHRHLQALGYADPGDGTGRVWGGVIGSRMLLIWFDLAAPAYVTTTPQVVDDTMQFHKRSGKTSRSALERYDFEFAFRLDIADQADARTSADEPPPVVPVKIKECDRCAWQGPCDADLRASDDVSLVNGVGYPEWTLHRHMGNPTTKALAGLNPDQIAAYDGTPIKPAELLKQIENARAVQAGGPIIRQAVEIPRGDIEIDFDLECTVNPAQVYLWGALLTHDIADWPEPSGTYVPFASWEPMTVEREAQLVADLWAWLQQQITLAEQRGLTVRIYGYNLASTETAHLRRISATGAATGLPSADELAEFFGHERYVDLLDYMRPKWISNDGHGLKVMAPAHGFHWSDEDPGGFNSIDWYNAAVKGNDAEMVHRILAYNHDDCRATLALREH